MRARITLTALCALLLPACGPATDEAANAAAPAHETAVPIFDGTSYGEPITLTEVTPISTIADRAADMVGERVLVSGTVEAVCEMMGCWMQLSSDREHEHVRVKVDDGVIVFPPSAKGRTALVEGLVEAVQAGDGGPTTYRIRGLGALIEDGPAGG
jgi:hypothetical protein